MKPCERNTKSFFCEDWENYARCYDSLLALTPYKDMLTHVSSMIPRDKKITLLDASCGTGNFELALLTSPLHQESSILGIDSSEEMLERAQKKCNAYNQIHFLEADLNIPLMLPSETFSHVVSLNTLYAVKNPLHTLLEFFRVLKPHGELFLVTPKYDFENGLILKKHSGSTLPDEYWHDAHASPQREELLIREALHDEETITNMLTVARYNRAIANTSSFHFLQQEELTELIKEAGFTVVNVSLTYAHQDFFITAQKGL